MSAWAWPGAYEPKLVLGPTKFRSNLNFLIMAIQTLSLIFIKDDGGSSRVWNFSQWWCFVVLGLIMPYNGGASANGGICMHSSSKLSPFNWLHT
jgi:hypothetical protein